MTTTVEYKGKVYPFPEKLMLAETAYCESKLRADVDEWFKAQTTMAMIFIAIKRVDPGLLSWDALGQLGPEDFTIAVEPEEPAGDQLEEDPATWPLDPTDGSVPTASSSESGPSPLTHSAPAGTGIG